MIRIPLYFFLDSLKTVSSIMGRSKRFDIKLSIHIFVCMFKKLSSDLGEKIKINFASFPANHSIKIACKAFS